MGGSESARKIAPPKRRRMSFKCHSWRNLRQRPILPTLKLGLSNGWLALWLYSPPSSSRWDSCPNHAVPRACSVSCRNALAGGCDTLGSEYVTLTPLILCIVRPDPVSPCRTSPELLRRNKYCVPRTSRPHPPHNTTPIRQKLAVSSLMLGYEEVEVVGSQASSNAQEGDGGRLSVRVG